MSEQRTTSWEGGNPTLLYCVAQAQECPDPLYERRGGGFVCARCGRAYDLLGTLTEGPERSDMATTLRENKALDPAALLEALRAIVAADANERDDGGWVSRRPGSHYRDAIHAARAIIAGSQAASLIPSPLPPPPARPGKEE